MKNWIVVLVTVMAAVLLAMPLPAFAGDAAQGRQVFANNCASCHMGGGNVVMRMKTLKQDALETYLENYGTDHSIDAIVYQVTNGKNAMPAFKGRLTDEQIANVAAYISAQAESDWATN